MCFRRDSLEHIETPPPTYDEYVKTADLYVEYHRNGNFYLLVIMNTMLRICVYICFTESAVHLICSPCTVSRSHMQKWVESIFATNKSRILGNFLLIWRLFFWFRPVLEREDLQICSCVEFVVDRIMPVDNSNAAIFRCVLTPITTRSDALTFHHFVIIFQIKNLFIMHCSTLFYAFLLALTFPASCQLGLYGSYPYGYGMGYDSLGTNWE